MNTDPKRLDSTANPQNGAETRLLKSALTLFSEKGYDGTSVREIIEAAGVTRPVLYYYFENKQDLYWRLLKHVVLEGLRIIDEELAAASGCRNRLKAFIRSEFMHADEAPEVDRLVLQAFFSPVGEGPDIDRDWIIRERLGRIVRIMEEGIASGEVGRGDAMTLAVAFAGFMDMHIMGKAHQPQAHLSSDLGEALVDLFLDGASSPGESGDALQSPFTIRGEVPGAPGDDRTAPRTASEDTPAS